MSTFYLLPPRPRLGERLAGYLHALFPGLEWGSATWTDLADAIGSAAARHPDVYVIYGEELPEGPDLRQVLADGFGAEAGDEVVEVQPGTKPGDVTTRRWRLTALRK
jgi:hypothetical protein